MTLTRINPAASAPYAVRYVTEDRQYAINFRFSLARNLMDAQVWRLVKGSMWQRVGDTIHTPARGASEATEEMAARYIAAARS